MFFMPFQQSNTGMNTNQGINKNTLLLVGAGGLALYLILRK